MRTIALTLPALAFAIAFGLPHPSDADAAAGQEAAVQPVAVGDLLRLVEAGAGETLLSRLIQDRGVRPPVEVSDLVALKRAGLSDELASEVLASARGTAARSVSYREEDGVLVVEGRGEPSDEAASPAPSPAPAPPMVVVVDERSHEHAEPAGDDPPYEAPAPANPYPVGATFGVSGGAVFLPAHFGDPPSSFGRTVVLPPAVPPYPVGWWGYPHASPPVFVPSPPGQGAPWAPAGSDRGLIGIRTSRGIRYVPN